MTKIRVQPEGDHVTVYLEGVMTFHDHEEGDRLIQEVGPHLQTQGLKSVRFDLQKLTSMDSHWLGIIIRLLRRARESNIRLELRHPNEEVRRLLDIVHLGRVVEIVG